MTARVVVVVVVAMLASQGAGRHTISGRVHDARGQLAAGVALALCTLDDQGGSGCASVVLKGDGSFTTTPLADGVYVLEAGPSLNAASRDASIERGLEVVSVSGRDLTSVAVRPSRYSLRGRYVMRTDNPAAGWPSHIHLVAPLVIASRAYAVGDNGSTDRK